MKAVIAFWQADALELADLRFKFPARADAGAFAQNHFHSGAVAQRAFVDVDRCLNRVRHAKFWNGFQLMIFCSFLRHFVSGKSGFLDYSTDRYEFKLDVQWRVVAKSIIKLKGGFNGFTHFCG